MDGLALDGLSERAQRFFSANAVREAGTVLDSVADAWGREEAEGASLAVLLDTLNSRYGGLRVPVLGGQLEGMIRLGFSGRPDSVWEGSGLLMARFAEHDTAQCALVVASDGRFGCSWAGEFSPLFESLEAMFEDVAVWGSLRGWRYVAEGDFPADEVCRVLGDMESDPVANGWLARWWFGQGLAVSAAAYLNSRRSSHPLVTVLGESTAVVAEARARIAGLPGAPPVERLTFREGIPLA